MEKRDMSASVKYFRLLDDLTHILNRPLLLLIRLENVQESLVYFRFANESILDFVDV